MSTTDDSSDAAAAPPSSDAKQRAAFALIAQITLADHVDAHALRRIQLLGEDAIPALVEAATFEERALRRFAVQSLAAIASRKGLASLLNVADEERQRNADLVAISLQGAAAVLRPSDCARVAPFVLEFASHPDRFVRAAVADVLRVLDAREERQTLLRLAHERDAFVAERASLALAHLDMVGNAEPAAPQQLGAPASVGAPVPAPLPSHTPAPAYAPPTPEPPARSGHPLVDRLASEDAAERRHAVAELAEQPGATDLIARHLGSPHAHLRSSMLEAASARAEAALFRPLLAQIESTTLDDHALALALRGLVPDAGADLDVLGRAAHRFSQSNDLFVRAEAFACGIRGGVPYDDELYDRGRRDPEEYVRERVEEAWRHRPVFRNAPAPPLSEDDPLADTSPEEPRTASTLPPSDGQAEPHAAVDAPAVPARALPRSTPERAPNDAAHDDPIDPLEDTMAAESQWSTTPTPSSLNAPSSAPVSSAKMPPSGTSAGPRETLIEVADE